MSNVALVLSYAWSLSGDPPVSSSPETTALDSARVEDETLPTFTGQQEHEDVTGFYSNSLPLFLFHLPNSHGPSTIESRPLSEFLGLGSCQSSLTYLPPNLTFSLLSLSEQLYAF